MIPNKKTMDALNYTVEKFNANTKLLQEYLNHDTTKQLFQDHELGKLDDASQQEYDEIQLVISMNKQQEEGLLEQINLAKKIKLEALGTLKNLVPEAVEHYNMESWVDN